MLEMFMGGRLSASARWFRTGFTVEESLQVGLKGGVKVDVQPGRSPDDGFVLCQVPVGLRLKLQDATGFLTSYLCPSCESLSICPYEWVAAWEVIYGASHCPVRAALQMLEANLLKAVI